MIIKRRVDDGEWEELEVEVGVLEWEEDDEPEPFVWCDGCNGGCYMCADC